MIFEQVYIGLLTKMVILQAGLNKSFKQRVPVVECTVIPTLRRLQDLIPVTIKLIIRIIPAIMKLRLVIRFLHNCSFNRFNFFFTIKFYTRMYVLVRIYKEIEYAQLYYFVVNLFYIFY